MKKRTEKWRSPSLGRDMQLSVFGDSGTPILAFPTRGQKCGQWHKFGMIEAISHQLENGYNQLFCVDTIDEQSLLNKEIPPSKRMVRQQQYETYIMEEVIPFIRQQSSINFLIAAGVDLGGYHAMTFALKHPEEFGKAIGISGLYDIRPMLDDYYDDDIYYNNPVDFVPNINKQKLLNDIRAVDFRLVSYTHDSRSRYAERLSKIFRMKFIRHELDIWDLEESGEWQLWPQMLQTHII